MIVKKDNGSDLYLNIDPIFEELNMEEGDMLKNINGVDVYFYNHTYKFVPTDYELTEEDKEKFLIMSQKPMICFLSILNLQMMNGILVGK